MLEVTRGLGGGAGGAVVKREGGQGEGAMDLVGEVGDTRQFRRGGGMTRRHGAGSGPELLHEAEFFQHRHGGGAGGVFEDEAEFLADTLAGDGLEVGGVAKDGGTGGGFEGEVETGGETHSTQHAEVVFAEAGFGVADGAEGLGLDINLAPDEVVELAGAIIGEGVEEEAVAGEVAAKGVLFGGREVDRVGVAAVSVGAVGAEGGDFDLQALAVRLFDEEDDAEGGADLLAAGEEGEDLIGGGGSGHIVILGRAAHELVADTATGEVGGVAGGLQALDNAPGEVFGGDGHGGIVRRARKRGNEEMRK